MGFILHRFDNSIELSANSWLEALREAGYGSRAVERERAEAEANGEDYTENDEFFTRSFYYRQGRDCRDFELIEEV